MPPWPDQLIVPAGRGRAAFVDVRDVAELAARTFAQAELRGRAWTLTGPEAVTFDEVAAMLSEELHRPICYRAASIPAYMSHLRRRGLPWMQIIVQTVLHVGLRFGNAAHVDPALSDLLGRPARGVRDVIRDARAEWIRSGREVSR